MVDTITPAPTQTTVDPVAVSNAPSVTTPESPVQPAPVVEATTTPVTETKASETLLGAPETVPEPTKEITPPVVVTPEVKVEPDKVVTENKEGSQSAEPAPPPTYEAFKLPEGVSLQEETLGKFTALLADLETKGKAEHALVQEFGQKAVDFYIAEMQTAITNMNQSMQTAWDQQKNGWKEKFLKDPDIGGVHQQETVDNARTFLRTHGGTTEQQKEFRELMETSGLGNHPAMIRLLANAAKAMSEGKPLSAVKPANTSVKSKVQTMYGSLATST